MSIVDYKFNSELLFFFSKDPYFSDIKKMCFQACFKDIIR